MKVALPSPVRDDDRVEPFAGTSAKDDTPPTVDTSPTEKRRRRPSKRMVSGIALGVVVGFAGYMAVGLHRNGHQTGDDFALYLRMAQSLFEGNMAEVIADNRFLYENSTAVTPPIYPWGWPLLLSPFVRLWGLDLDRLKLIEVAVFCAWLVLFHGIVRRRAGRIVALAATAVFATSYNYLVHTDQLLSEFPHMLAVAVVVWWLDRIMTHSRLTAAATSDLVILGLLIVGAYNVRREGLMLVLAVGAAQLVDLATDRQVGRRGNGIPVRKLLLPYVTFGAGALVAQLLLPSTLIPDNDNSTSNITTRLWGLDERPNRGNYPHHLVAQLGLDRLDQPQVLGRWLLVIAAVGAVVACLRNPRRNVPLAVLGLSTMLVIGTHFRMVDRYYLQITPLIVLFITLLIKEAATAGWRLVGRTETTRSRRGVAVFASVPLLLLTVLHLGYAGELSGRRLTLWDRVEGAQRFNDAGSQQSGPTNRNVVTAFPMVLAHTNPDDVIIFYRSRTLTLYTGRRSLQPTSLTSAMRYGDYFMQNLTRDYSQPVATDEQLLAAGLQLVDEDEYWRLWRIP